MCSAEEERYANLAYWLSLSQEDRDGLLVAMEYAQQLLALPEEEREAILRRIREKHNLSA